MITLEMRLGFALFWICWSAIVTVAFGGALLIELKDAKKKGRHPSAFAYIGFTFLSAGGLAFLIMLGYSILTQVQVSING